MPRGSAGSTAPTTSELGRVLLGAPAARSELSRIALATLLQRTRGELALAARLLGLKGLSKLRKNELAELVRKALRSDPSSRNAARRHARTRNATVRTDARGGAPRARAGGARQSSAGRPAGDRRGVEDGESGARSKFDLGSRQKQAPVEHIPWDYNQNRVTAMIVDPQTMYAYWEVRDDAIESARAALGPGGADAWMNLRVYDISGRIFDGTNAHSYLDAGVERGDRQWFFTIGRPTSTHCVEIGMLSPDGRFQKIARSGRVDFPRAEPAGAGPIEWLSVHAITGEVAAPVPGAAPHSRLAVPAPEPPQPAAARQPGAGARAEGEGEYWVVNDFGSLGEWAILSGWESHDFLRTEWIGGHGRFEWSGGRQRFEWVGPVVRTSWEAGPFPIPVEAPGLVEERHEGPVLVHKLGDQTRIIYGPWQVVIRGIGARAEGRVLATWEVRKSWVTHVGFEVVDGRLRWEALAAPDVVMGTPGASEGLQPGSSERRWLAGSEVRLAGASELFRVGASEVRYLGASETLFAGASETRYRGASERRWLGASETMVIGASEGALRGASETLRRGASERKYAGASERAGRGGSEQRLGGASESRPQGASENPGKKSVYPTPGRAPRKG